MGVTRMKVIRIIALLCGFFILPQILANVLAADLRLSLVGVMLSTIFLAWLLRKWNAKASDVLLFFGFGVLLNIVDALIKLGSAVPGDAPAVTIVLLLIGVALAVKLKEPAATPPAPAAS